MGTCDGPGRSRWRGEVVTLFAPLQTPLHKALSLKPLPKFTDGEPESGVWPRAGCPRGEQVGKWAEGAGALGLSSLISKGKGRSRRRGPGTPADLASAAPRRPPTAPPAPRPSRTYFPEPLTPINSSALGAAIARSPVAFWGRSAPPSQPRGAEPPATQPGPGGPHPKAPTKTPSQQCPTPHPVPSHPPPTPTHLPLPLAPLPRRDPSHAETPPPCALPQPPRPHSARRDPRTRRPTTSPSPHFHPVLAAPSAPVSLVG